MTGFQRQLMVITPLTPVRQPLRRLPFALQDLVSVELKGMIAMDLIEPIDAKPWN